MLCACGVVNNITCSVVTGAFDVQSSIDLQTADPFFVSPTNFTPQRGHDAFVTFVIIAIQPTKGMVLTVKIPLPLFRRIVVYVLSPQHCSLDTRLQSAIILTDSIIINRQSCDLHGRILTMDQPLY